MTRPLELLTVGRVSVDLYAEQQRVGFAEARTFAKSVGGSPTNVAVAAARLGHRSAVVTAVGADPFGEYVREALAGFGVDTRFVGTHAGLRTPLAFAAMDPPEDPQLLFYRAPEAPDAHIATTDELLDAARIVPILWISASALAVEPSRSTSLALLEAHGRTDHVVLDLDWRPTFWATEDEGRRVIGDAVDCATIAIGNRSECQVAVGSSDPDEAANALLAHGVEVAVVKLGSDGVLVVTSDERRVVPPVPVSVVCGLGAGDSFGGAFCHGLLSGLSPFDAVELGNAAGAIVASRLLCADAMPTVEELDEILERTRAGS